MNCCMSWVWNHTDGTIQIEFSQTSKYSFNQDFISIRSSTSNTSLNSVYFTPKIHIPIYQQQEFLLVSSTHSDILMFLLSSLLGQKKTKIEKFFVVCWAKCWKEWFV